MKLLITGIHGFVGSNLVAALGDKFEIYGLDIVAPDKKGVKKTYSWNDLDNGAVPQVDAIIHLAGKAHDTKNKSAADVYFKINTGLTQKTYDYFVASAASKFIFFSSVKAAADFVPGDVLTEDVVPNPVGPYGESKIKAEQYIQSKPYPDGKQVYILRPCMIHGPGNKGNLNLLYSVVRKGIPWPLGSFDNKRTFTSIDNLTFVINGLLTKSVKSGIYHMADDDAVSTNHLIELICQSLGKKAHIWHVNKGLIECAAKVGNVLRLPLNSDRLNKLTENYVASNAKIKHALGVNRMPVSAEQGLLKTLNSFKS
jgi:nucleoside-diphosphate-sugar epimerase